MYTILYIVGAIKKVKCTLALEDTFIDQAFYRPQSYLHPYTILRPFFYPKSIQNCHFQSNNKKKLKLFFFKYPTIGFCSRLIWECLGETSQTLPMYVAIYNHLKWRKQGFLLLDCLNYKALNP